MSLTLEQLESKTNQIRSDLDALKKLTESAEKQQKQDEISKHLEELRTEAEEQLNSATDENERKKITALKDQLQSYSHQLDSLQTTVIDNHIDTLGNKVQSEETVTSSKDSSWRDKTKDFTKEQWDSIWDKEKRKDEAGMNTLRAAGFVATGVGAVALAYKGLKSLFGWGKKKEKSEQQEQSSHEKKDKKISRWKKGLLRAGGIGSAVGIGILGYKNWDWIKGKWNDIMGNNLSFEEALIKAKSDILNKPEETGMKQSLNFAFNKDDSTLQTYGQSTKIDVKKKRVEGLNIQFSKYEEMLTAAIITNYVKYAYQGKCQNNEPFHLSDKFGGDIDVNLATGTEEAVSGEGTGGKRIGGGAGGILSLVGGIYGRSPKLVLALGAALIPTGIALGNYVDCQSTLNKVCPPLRKGVGMEKFMVYLNQLGGREKGNQTTEITDSPIKSDVEAIKDEIEREEVENYKEDDLGEERKIDAIQDKDDPTKYKIVSWGGNIVNITVSSEKKVYVEGLDVEFPLKEGIMVANLTNKIKKTYAGHCGTDAKPFTYKNGILTLGNPGLYINNEGLPDRIIKKQTLETKYPILLPHIESHYIPYLHKIKDSSSNLPLWVKQK